MREKQTSTHRGSEILVRRSRVDFSRLRLSGIDPWRRRIARHRAKLPGAVRAVGPRMISRARPASIRIVTAREPVWCAARSGRWRDRRAGRFHPAIFRDLHGPTPADARRTHFRRGAVGGFVGAERVPHTRVATRGSVHGELRGTDRWRWIRGPHLPTTLDAIGAAPSALAAKTAFGPLHLAHAPGSGLHGWASHRWIHTDVHVLSRIRRDVRWVTSGAAASAGPPVYFNGEAATAPGKGGGGEGGDHRGAIRSRLLHRV